MAALGVEILTIGDFLFHLNRWIRAGTFVAALLFRYGGHLCHGLLLLRSRQGSNEIPLATVPGPIAAARTNASARRNDTFWLGLITNRNAQYAKSKGEPMPKAIVNDPRETPLDDPRQQTDMPTHRQTEKPWQGNPEKDQIDPKRPPIDLEKWQKSNTH